MKYKYRLSLSWPFMVLLCVLTSYGTGFFTVHTKPWLVVACGIATIICMAAILISAKLTHFAWTHARGRAIPLFEFVRDGEEVRIRGMSPHLIDVGKTNIHLLVERGIDRMHCVIDDKVFDATPVPDSYFKRIGNQMRYLRSY